MKVTIQHNGFHGWHTVSFFDESPIEIEPNYYEAQISLRVGKRLNDIVCGCSDCKCGENVADCYTYRNNDNTGIAVVRYKSTDNGKTGEIRGNYPQQN